MTGPDLSTTWLGLALAHPVVASASPLTGRIDTLAELEAAGAAAVVLTSLFQEEVEAQAFDLDRLLVLGTESQPEAAGYLPDLGDLASGAERHLDLVAAAKSVLRIPVIASLNGTTPGGWVRYAAELAEAGADALELNTYLVAASPDDTAELLEGRLIELVGSVCDAVRIPVAVKLSPYFTALAHMATALVDAGAAGLVLFNRFVQPDIDVATMTMRSVPALSHPDELRLPLRWIGLLHGTVRTEFALSAGVEDGLDVVKAVLAGAHAVMSTSALLRHGPRHVAVLRGGLADWLALHGYASVTQARGSFAHASCPDPGAFERAGYLQTLRHGGGAG